jgi:hypothetical protein
LKEPLTNSFAKEAAIFSHENAFWLRMLVKGMYQDRSNFIRRRGLSLRQYLVAFFFSFLILYFLNTVTSNIVCTIIRLITENSISRPSEYPFHSQCYDSRRKRRHLSTSSFQNIYPFKAVQRSKVGEGRERDTQYEKKYRNFSRQYNQSAEGRERSRNRSNRRSPLTPAFSLLTCKKEQKAALFSPASRS